MEAMLKTLLILASLPALGMVETTKETFAGWLDGGELVLMSDDRGGVECRGMAARGVVVVTCGDGRQGVVRFRGPNGYGNLDGEPFTVVLPRSDFSPQF